MVEISELTVVSSAPISSLTPARKIIMLGDIHDPLTRFEIESGDPVDGQQLSPYDSQLVYEGLSHGLQQAKQVREEIIDKRSSRIRSLWVGIGVIDGLYAVGDELITTETHQELTGPSGITSFNTPDFVFASLALAVVGAAGHKFIRRNFKPKIEAETAKVSRIKKALENLKIARLEQRELPSPQISQES